MDRREAKRWASACVADLIDEWLRDHGDLPPGDGDEVTRDEQRREDATRELRDELARRAQIPGQRRTT